MLSPEIISLAGDVRRLLAYQSELGLRGLNVPPTILRARTTEPQVQEAKRPASAEDREASAATRRQAAAEVMKILGRRSTPASSKPSTNQPAEPIEVALDGPDSLSVIEAQLAGCTRCKLHSGRTQLVFGVGNPNARLMFVGEGPGRDEDLQGEPFVGKAGQLLDKMIVAMGLQRGDVYIANIVKCRPPGNRDPQPDEVGSCEPFLQRQIRLIKPEVIVALGRYASQTLAGETTAISRLRGKWLEYEGIALMPTFHPAYLLRNPAEKRPVWADLQEVMRRLGI